MNATDLPSLRNTDPATQQKAAKLVQNTPCPSCGRKFRDITYEYLQAWIFGKLKEFCSGKTIFHVVQTEVPYAIGQCPGNCQNKNLYKK